MPHCNHCGNFVSNRFVRVFADEDGQILACPDCSAIAGVVESARQRAEK